MPALAKVSRSDRRNAGRFASRQKAPAHLTRATTEGSWMASVRNISSKGIGLVANRPVLKGMMLTVELPGDKGSSQPKLLKVMHTHAGPGSKWWFVGGQFVRELTKEELDALRSRSPSIVPHDERRTQVRHTTRIKTGCKLVRVMEVGHWQASIRNVSQTGVSLITGRACKPSMLLTVELPMKDKNLQRPRLVRVVHAKPQPGNRWWVAGGEFLTRLSKEELASLL